MIYILIKEREIDEKDVYCVLKACKGEESSDITVKTLQAVNKKCYGKGRFTNIFMTKIQPSLNN